MGRWMGLSLKGFVVRVYFHDIEPVFKNTAAHFPCSEAFLVCALYVNVWSS